MTQLYRTAAGGALLLALAVGAPTSAVQAETMQDVAQDNLAQVFDPTLRRGATSQQAMSTAEQPALATQQRIFDRYWALEQGAMSGPRVSFAAFETQGGTHRTKDVARSNLDAVFKAN